MSYEEHFLNLKSNQTVGECGPPFYFVAKKIVETYNIKKIVEIGFNRGSSALAFLLFGIEVISIDIRSMEEVKESINYLFDTFPDKFRYISGDSDAILPLKIFPSDLDMIFIDGDHSYNHMLSDCKNSIALKPKYLLLDDYDHPSHGPDLKRIIEELKLTILERWDNRVLIKLDLDK